MSTPAQKKFFAMMSGIADVLVDTINASTIAEAKYHIDAGNSNYETARTATTGNYNPSPKWSAFKSSSSYYVIFRSILRFDFTSVASFSFTKAKLFIVKYDISWNNDFGWNTEPYAFRLPNDSTITGDDYDNYTTQYSDKGVKKSEYIFELTLNSNAIADLQSAITNNEIFTIMLRDYKDVEAITPIDDTQNDQYLSELCYIEFYQ